MKALFKMKNRSRANVCSSSTDANSRKLRVGILLALVSSSGLGCGSSEPTGTGGDSGTGGTGGSDTSQQVIDPDNFVSTGLLEGSSITTEPCTLSGGTETTCYRIEVAGAPTDHDVGPFCPTNISDGADAGGRWIEDDQVYDLTGAFIANLATFYNDDNWLLYDVNTGEINVTDTQESCEAAARPDVDEQYQNHCVECSLDYVGGGVSVTYLLPTEPVALGSNAEIGRMGSVGVALNGIVFDAPAPVDAILGAYTIAAFDDCGGHVNPFAGYHYHGAAGCGTNVEQDDEHAPLIGYAFDGYGMHAMLNEDGSEPTDLDECRGHSDEVRGYHYHVAGAGENTFIGCFHGEQGGVE